MTTRVTAEKGREGGCAGKEDEERERGCSHASWLFARTEWMGWRQVTKVVVPVSCLALGPGPPPGIRLVRSTKKNSFAMSRSNQSALQCPEYTGRQTSIKAYATGTIWRSSLGMIAGMEGFERVKCRLFESRGSRGKGHRSDSPVDGRDERQGSTEVKGNQPRCGGVLMWSSKPVDDSGEELAEEYAEPEGIGTEMPRTLKFARPDYPPLEPVNHYEVCRTNLSLPAPMVMVNHAPQRIQINYYCTDMWMIRIPAGSPILHLIQTDPSTRGHPEHVPTREQAYAVLCSSRTQLEISPKLGEVMKGPCSSFIPRALLGRIGGSQESRWSQPPLTR
ncbi:uncharacterized protein BO96DRAFT_469612 [Aspergillus niger CBS 101883]|uniref:uncharacterized protein n=1 Tax=Aspergillus lacticoffeatus (strain CBS 101883) TaxID=1450533 RepID=UPI000D7ED725|nr:uncharacterized protein BO96DRAFT_469612 [Aspergillus niger CBS 101883]PYH51951.1 hypothetical protein BO96DRAFT_469612 [Aspergillus niger CBS 101883]